MIEIICEKDQREDIKEYLFTELSKMYLHSVCYLSGTDSYYDKKDYELIERGKEIIKAKMPVQDTSGGFSIDTMTTEDICFELASKIRNENSYTDQYHCDKEGSIEFALQNVINGFPGTTINGDFEVVGNCYEHTDKIMTKHGRVVVMSDLGEECSVEEEVLRYDQKRYLDDALKNAPYTYFLELFKIDGDYFKVKDYKYTLLVVFLKREVIFDYEKSDYNEFEMFIFLITFDHDAMKLTEDEYRECMYAFVSRLPDPKDYLIQ